MATKSVTVQWDQIADEYKREVKDVMTKTMKKTGSEAARKLRSTSPVQNGGKHSGRYARGWSLKTVSSDEFVVYNRTDWRLTHLLENGHDVYNQLGGPFGHSPAIPHIAPVEEWVLEEVPIRISRGLK